MQLSQTAVEIINEKEQQRISGDRRIAQEQLLRENLTSTLEQLVAGYESGEFDSDFADMIAPYTVNPSQMMEVFANLWRTLDLQQAQINGAMAMHDQQSAISNILHSLIDKLWNTVSGWAGQTALALGIITAVSTTALAVIEAISLIKAW